MVRRNRKRWFQGVCNLEQSWISPSVQILILLIFAVLFWLDWLVCGVFDGFFWFGVLIYEVLNWLGF